MTGDTMDDHSHDHNILRVMISVHNNYVTEHENTGLMSTNYTRSYFDV